MPALLHTHRLSTLIAASSIAFLAFGTDVAVAAPACDEVAGPNEHPRHFVKSLQRGEAGCFRGGRTYRSPHRTIKVTAPGVTLTTRPGGKRAKLVGRLWLPRRADGVTVNRLRLKGRNRRRQASPTINASKAVFSRNVVTNGRTGICFLLGNSGYGRARGTVIRRNRIHDCGKRPATNRQHGIYLAHARNTQIRDNWIYDNADRGIQLYPDAEGTTITGNVIDGNGQGIIFSGDSDDRSHHNLVVGNVITFSRIRYNVEAHWPGPVGSGNVVRGNCLWASRWPRRSRPRRSGIESPRVGFAARNNVVAKPRYESRKGGDYRLRAASRCRKLLR